MMSNISNILPLLEDSDDITTLLLLMKDEEDDLPRADTFNLNNLTDTYCILHFRFSRNDINRIYRALRFPTYFKLRNDMVIPGIEALCILLRRFSYPNRLVDLMEIFPRTRCDLSRIVDAAVNFIFDRHRILLENIKHPFLTRDALEDFSNSIYDAGAPYKMCFGFLDGTVRPMCRPVRNQRMFYNGHKRTHALKYQSLMLPNGIIATMHGPVYGRRHDAHVLHQSKILEELDDPFFTKEGQSYFIYGDPAYPLRKNLIVPFKYDLNPIKRACNKRMSRVRECVEWGFCKIVQNFAFIDFKKNMKYYLMPIDKYYLVSTILTNCHTCLYGSQTSEFFHCSPPDLETYLRYM